MNYQSLSTRFETPAKQATDKHGRCAGADAAAYICNGESGKSAHSIAEATASAFAQAVASASATCEVQGHAEVHVAASASAIAAAEVWVAAYAQAFASAGDCDKCDAYSASYGYVEKEVFLKAVAQADVKVRLPAHRVKACK